MVHYQDNILFDPIPWIKICDNPNYNINSIDSSDEILINNNQKYNQNNIINYGNSRHLLKQQSNGNTFDFDTFDIESSFDDSSEEQYILDTAVFKNTPNGKSINCNNNINMNNDNNGNKIDIDMYEEKYIKNNRENVYIYLIYNNFKNCDLIQDPYVFVDITKLDDYTVNDFKHTIIIATILGIIIGLILIIMAFVRNKYKKYKMNTRRIKKIWISCGRHILIKYTIY